MMQKPKTSEAQRRAVANYQEKIDRVNCRFPKGTKQRIEATGESINGFIIRSVLADLDRLEVKTERTGPEEQAEDKPPFM